jgi:hypothetical protein
MPCLEPCTVSQARGTLLRYTERNAASTERDLAIQCSDNNKRGKPSRLERALVVAVHMRSDMIATEFGIYIGVSA